MILIIIHFLIVTYIVSLFIMFLLVIKALKEYSDESRKKRVKMGIILCVLGIFLPFWLIVLIVGELCCAIVWIIIFIPILIEQGHLPTWKETEKIFEDLLVFDW